MSASLQPIGDPCSGGVHDPPLTLLVLHPRTDDCFDDAHLNTTAPILSVRPNRVARLLAASSPIVPPFLTQLAALLAPFAPALQFLQIALGRLVSADF